MKVKPTSVPPQVDSGVVAIVLRGWAAGSDSPGCFDLFASRTAGILRVWAAHEPFLRAEAVRLGIQPDWPMPGGRRGFFAEALKGE